MEKAYKLSNFLVRDRLKSEAKGNESLMEEIEKNDLVVIDGTYDHIHLVLENLRLPFVRLSHADVAETELQAHQTVFVNCANSFPPEAARKLATFVVHGGQLITTDWALKFVLEVAFPGVVAYNKKPTADEVVRIEVMDKEDPVIKGFLDEETDPLWWLEGSSYPITVNDPKVNVLIRSKELKERYGEDAVLIKFQHGQGIVYHMISHFYLQRTETREKKQEGKASTYSNIKGGSVETMEAMEAAGDVSYGEMQSASTSAEFILRAVINQKRKSKK